MIISTPGKHKEIIRERKNTFIYSYILNENFDIKDDLKGNFRIL